MSSGSPPHDQLGFILGGQFFTSKILLSKSDTPSGGSPTFFFFFHISTTIKSGKESGRSILVHPILPHLLPSLDALPHHLSSILSRRLEPACPSERENERVDEAEVIMSAETIFELGGGGE
jgi:hypothetical protein